jgi:chorismate mutase
MRAIVGEVVVEREGADAVADATRALLARLVAAHGVESEDVVSAVFTLTPDVVDMFPAAVARDMGWTDVPLLCVAAVPVPGAPRRRVQVLLHVSRER